MIVHASPRPGVRRPPAGVRRRFYPAPWYLDLVRLRRRAATGAGVPAGVGLAPPAGDGDDATLVALAVELTGLDELEALPYGVKRHVLGLDVAEVRAYLRHVDREASLTIRGEAADRDRP